MTTDTQRGSATIYQFPLRGRFTPGYREPVESALQIAHVESGSGWYHQQAIDEASPTRKN